MKNLYRILIMLVAIQLTACSKDFINISPTSTVSVDILFKTDKDFQDALAGTYNTLQDTYRTFWMFGDLRGEDNRAGISSNTPAGAFDIDEFFLGNDAPILSTTWLNYYKLINRANTILSKLETADATIVVNKNRHTAEAKFLRALAYFDLVRIFGDVPKVTTPVTVQESYKIGRETVAKIYEEVIIPDLLAADPGLSVKYTGSDIGRPTRGAAKALLGKVYLTRKDYAKAEAKLAEVTTMGYALLANFNDLFDYSKNEHHTEYIFDVEFEAGINEGSSFTTQFAIDFQGGGSGMVNEQNRLYNLGGMGNDSGIPSQAMFDAFDPKDKRKDITVAKGFYGKDSVFIPLSTTGVFAFTKKYMAPLLKVNDSPANWKVIRYADVLLMYAEALNENNKTTEALTNLNLVHVRAGLTKLAGLSQAEIRDKIMLERRCELYLEGQRWFDLVRTGKAYDVMKSYGMKPYMTLFPIPLSQILLVNDKTVLAQNAGYE